MKENKLAELSMEFSVDIINLVRACHDLAPEGINFNHKTEKGNK